MFDNFVFMCSDCVIMNKIAKSLKKKPNKLAQWNKGLYKIWLDKTNVYQGPV